MQKETIIILLQNYNRYIYTINNSNFSFYFILPFLKLIIFVRKNIIKISQEKMMRAKRTTLKLTSGMKIVKFLLFFVNFLFLVSYYYYISEQKFIK